MSKRITIQQALGIGCQALKPSSSAQLDARLLLQHVAGVNHAQIIAHGERALTAEQEFEYRELLSRAGRGEPIPYLIGRASFLGRDYIVTPSVLIPRPETESLVQRAVAWAEGKERLRLVDVGTGSGCIAISLAHLLPEARIVATDVSAEAIAVARANAIVHDVHDRLEFYKGNLIEHVPGPLHLIVANLPYIADHEWTSLDVGVKSYEPDIALKGGPDGLSLIEHLLRQSRGKLEPGGAVLLEIGWQQGPNLSHLVRELFPEVQIKIDQDYSGLDRIVAITTK